MTQAVWTSITRRSVIAALVLTAALVGILVSTDNAYAQAKDTKSLYERLACFIREIEADGQLG